MQRSLNIYLTTHTRSTAHNISFKKNIRNTIDCISNAKRSAAEKEKTENWPAFNKTFGEYRDTKVTKLSKIDGKE